MNGAWRGTDRFGNDQSAMDAATKAVSGVVFLFGGPIADAYVGAANIIASEAIVVTSELNPTH